jgi:cell division protein FtsI/penicillin-binding protein 2
MKNVFIAPYRFYLVFFAIFLTFCSLGGRLFHLQVVNSEKYESFALNARKNFIPISARRGDLVDRKGNLLATTRSVVVVGMDPQSIEEQDRLKFDELAKLLQIPLEKISAAADKKIGSTGADPKSVRLVRWVKLKEEVEESEYRKIKKLGIKGVYGNYQHSRLYPNQSLASHILGYVNEEGKACMGVELLSDYYLKGQDGWRESERDGRRREMPQYRSLEVKEKDGLNVELTIDRMIQDIVEGELREIVNQYEPLSASIIVSSPKTGEILALGNVPTFDPNNYGEFPLENQRNRALTDLYEPGSTFKIVPVCGALNEGLIDPDDIIDCSIGSYQVGNRLRRLPSDHHPLGKISLREVVQKSSNRGAAQLGIKLGASRLFDYCKMFGFGDSSRIGLTGERSGMLHHPDRWDGLTITRLPMGHAVAVSAIQVHVAMSSVANDGILMRPILIRRVFDEEGKTVVNFNPDPVRRVVSEKVAKIMTEMLVSVVSPEGTAVRAKIKGYSVAGKTGTTQKIIDGKYSNRHHVASFCGFFPAEDPVVGVTVVVDEPNMTKGRLGYGGSVAGPVFQRVAKKVIGYMGIKPKPTELSFVSDRKSMGENF